MGDNIADTQKYPLSDAQWRIWYSQKKHSGSPLYNIGGTFHIAGPVDLSMLKEAITSFVKSHVAFGLRFYEKGSEVFQYYEENGVNIGCNDFTTCQDPGKAFECWRDELASEPFIMEHMPLYTFYLFKLSSQSAGYIIKAHHIIIDGWSMKLLTEQIARRYEQLKKGIADSNQEESFLSYVMAGRKETIEKQRKMRSFWTGLLMPGPETIRMSSLTLTGRRESFPVDPFVRAELESYVLERNLSVNIFFTALYFLHEYKFSGKTDVFVGIPLLGRSGKRERQIIGTFTNTMPIRCSLSPDETVSTFMRRVSSVMGKAYAYQKYPYNTLIQEQRKIQPDTPRLYDACINNYNTDMRHTIDGMPVESSEFYNGEQAYALQIILRDWNNDGLKMDFDYQSALYTSGQIRQMFNSYMNIAQQILLDVDIKINELTLACRDESRSFYTAFNNTEKPFPADKTWIELFGGQTKANGNAVAISKGEKQMDYRSLYESSGKAAEVLRGYGIKPGDILPFQAQHDLESIVIIIAIARTGAVYLPLDDFMPEKRVQSILLHTEARFYLGASAPDGFTGKWLRPEDILEAGSRISGSPDFKCLANPENTAYLIYTSGTSGQPKGVPIRHKSLLNYILWAMDAYCGDKPDVYPLYSAYGFDFTMTSLILPLVQGGEIRIFDNAGGANVFRNILQDPRPTILKITPSHIPLIMDVENIQAKIHTFIVGGEKLMAADAAGLAGKFGGVKIYNEYGPTESTVGCMTYLYNPLDNALSVPIGHPIANTRITLLDRDGKSVPTGMPGEIHIGGEGLTPGYYKMADETALKFVPDPFKPGGLIYKTGDMAFFNEAGSLIYIGRAGREVKLNGYRIDLYEIENMILSVCNLSGVIVSVHNNALYAYCAGSGDYDESSIKRALEAHLPSYMIPAVWIFTPCFPLTANGKVDTARLQNCEGHGKHQAAASIPHENIHALLAAVNAVMPEKPPSPDDNYYELGGDSIKAILISSRLQDNGFDLSVQDILANANIREMAGQMKKKPKIQGTQEVCRRDIPALPIWEWFTAQDFPYPGIYNQSLLLVLKKTMPVTIWENVFTALVQHHDALRMNWDKSNHTFFYNDAHATRPVTLEQMDIGDKPVEFDLRNDLLFHPRLLRRNGQEYLQLTAHHLCVDGLTWNILLNDIATLLKQAKSGWVLSLPDKTRSLASFTEEYAGDKREKPSYKQDNQKITYSQTAKAEWEADEAFTARLLKRVNGSSGMKPDELMLIAYAYAIGNLSGLDKVLIAVEEHGRDALDNVNVSRTAGWFTQVRVVEATPFANECPDYRHKTGKGGRHSPFSGGRFLFNYLGEWREQENEFFSVSYAPLRIISHPDNIFPDLIEFNAMVIHGRLNVAVTTADSHIPKKLLRYFKDRLRAFVEHK
ncbi:MAG: condensation domain-containing protein [Defluviitaleaceae bacterium]|nr:condensation domain-containing protein [Defluviitaleaceae bacterium]